MNGYLFLLICICCMVVSWSLSQVLTLFYPHIADALSVTWVCLILLHRKSSHWGNLTSVIFHKLGIRRPKCLSRSSSDFQSQKLQFLQFAENSFFSCCIIFIIVICLLVLWLSSSHFQPFTKFPNRIFYSSCLENFRGVKSHSTNDVTTFKFLMEVFWKFTYGR